MPKIVINEKDQTSSGTPGRYGNYAVLLAGYADSSITAGKVKPDENGVYEFSSKSDFLATIGDVEPAKKDGATVVEYHYGNKMAQGLLDMGYVVIYRVINKVSDMLDFDKFWGIFKDKASYDFRFVSHGMLETCYDQATHTSYYTRLEEIDAALAALAELEKPLNNGQPITLEAFNALDPTKKEEYTAAYADAEYSFNDNDGLPYSSYTTVKAGLNEDRTEMVNNIATHSSSEFTRDIFNEINGNIAKLACYKTNKDDTQEINAGRGDCVALIEVDEDVYCEADPAKRPEELIIEGIKGMSSKLAENGEYCALTVPSVHYYVDGVTTKKMPGAFHYLACFMSSLSSGFAEWYAAAGYTRGVSSYVIDHTSVKLGEIAIAALEPRYSETLPFACNVIANFRGSYYLWGNRTAAKLGTTEKDDLTAKHFLNIRQLCSTLKKQLYVLCRRFTFDPNSDTLWFNFVNSITPTLDAMKADQGIRDYRIVKEVTNKKATLKARIRIIPIEAVEDFSITVALEDSFGGVSVTAEG
jgi:hypothetical protein